MAMPGKGSGDEPEYLDEGPIDGEAQLAFADNDERLPWLESDDDYEQPGVDTGRIVTFAAIGLLVLVLTLGALWWFTGDHTDEALVADGSTIEAPEEPYRTRPDDPGGIEVAGTGETSFEVAEGQMVEGRIDDGAPAPSIDRDQVETPDATPTASPSTTPTAASSGVGVQVGAYSSRAAAEAGWSTLAARIEVLSGRSHRIVQGTADSGTIFRLQAVAGSVAEAQSLCRSIKSEGGDCQVKR